uniref:Uncharacterized protein n=1 Tax=Nothobranchius furzeri TaxID=105023 RepID=A0A8C6P3H3_NOTFU
MNSGPMYNSSNADLQLQMAKDKHSHYSVRHKNLKLTHAFFFLKNILFLGCLSDNYANFGSDPFLPTVLRMLMFTLMTLKIVSSDITGLDGLGLIFKLGNGSMLYFPSTLTAAFGTVCCCSSPASCCSRTLHAPSA